MLIAASILLVHMPLPQLNKENTQFIAARFENFSFASFDGISFSIWKSHSEELRSKEKSFLVSQF